jgi:hypothetical protein
MFEGVEGAGVVPVTGVRSPAHRPSSPADASAAAGPAGPGSEDSSGQGVEGESLRIGDVVTATFRAANPKANIISHVVLEWESGSIGDMVADAVVAVILQVRT